MFFIHGLGWSEITAAALRCGVTIKCWLFYQARAWATLSTMCENLYVLPDVLHCTPRTINYLICLWGRTLLAKLCMPKAHVDGHHG